MPGVLGVFSGADCLADGLAPIPHSPVPSTRYDLKLTGPGGGAIFIGPQPLLPRDKVRHVGEAVAMVVAETMPQALDGAEALEAEYEELPWVVASDAALASCAPVIWDEAPDNVIVDTMFGDAEATERAFAGADHVVEMDFHIGRVTAVPIEPRSALGHYDAASDRFTLHAGSGAVRQKAGFRGAGVAPNGCGCCLTTSRQFRCAQLALGRVGLALRAARQLARLVKYTASRSDVSQRFSGVRSGLVALACAPTAGFWHCAPTTSAMSAGVACHCRRSAKGRPWSPDPTTSRRRACARAPCSRTRCRPTPIAARVARKLRLRSSG
jgi:carbon-monoxide dehydrogenase large subunit